MVVEGMPDAFDSLLIHWPTGRFVGGVLEGKSQDPGAFLIPDPVPGAEQRLSPSNASSGTIRAEHMYDMATGT